MAIYDKNALGNLRAAMERDKIDYYLLTSSDYHASEYVSDYFKATEYISGCTSDNVVLIIGEKEAWLWTDGRYFISAAAELDGTGITLMKMGEKGVPTVDRFLMERLTGAAGSGDDKGATGSGDGEEAAGASGKNESGKTAVIAFDGRSVDAKRGAAYRRIAKKAGAELRGSETLIDEIWTERPAIPSHPVRVLSDDLCGKSFKEKLEELRGDLKKAGADHIVLMRLDDIMWLMNIRGGDVLHNPVALSYAFITPEACTLYIQESEVTDDFRAYANENDIALRPYDRIFEDLKEYSFPKGSVVLCDSAAASDTMAELLRSRTAVLDRRNPTEIRKACKNETEMANIRKYYLLDSVAVCKFISWVKRQAAQSRKTEEGGAAVPAEEGTDPAQAEADGEAFTEMAAARKMDALRAEIPGFFDLSFPTIPAYNANAAMAHYSPEGEGEVIGDHGFLLVDSGGQYLGATTDITRTIVLGELTEQMKRDFTLVAAGHFRLMNAVFKKGTTGAQLDLIAREPLYTHGLDFNHGTGHGIGYILNVHEGPQRIGPARPGTPHVAMEVGMVTSDEPGIYREGEYGIRTESIVLTVPNSESEFGTFLQFECLTWVPVDIEAIDPACLTAEDLAAINDYHKKVFEKVSPYLEGEDLEWLKTATAEIKGLR